MARKKTTKARGGPGRLSAEDAALLPDRLLDAALELFNERTYAEATMEQIARRAGASTKTLYARYADKAELVEAVVNRVESCQHVVISTAHRLAGGIRAHGVLTRCAVRLGRA